MKALSLLLLAIELEDSIIRFAARRIKAKEEKKLFVSRSLDAMLKLVSLTLTNNLTNNILRASNSNAATLICRVKKILWLEVTSHNKYFVTSITAICILLYKISTPARRLDLERKFEFSASLLSKNFGNTLSCAWIFSDKL